VRVLHVYKDVYPPVVGGIERHIDAIRNALPQIQHDVLICARGLRTFERASVSGGGREVLVGELGRFLSTPIAPTFPSWLARLAPGAIVHLHMPQPLAEMSVLLARIRTPIAATYHADIYRQRILLGFYGPLVRRILRRADVVIAASNALGNESPQLRDAHVPVHVVPYGIDVRQWTREKTTEGEVAALRNTFGHPHVIAVGRLVHYKGFDRLIAATRDVNASVVIVGEGPLRKQLERQVRSLRVEDRVHLVGEVSDQRLAAHLTAASVFVLPSTNRAEAFGISLLEAQAAGLPVIATDVGTGTKEAFIPDESGILVPPKEIAALGSAITRLIDQPELREAMGQAGQTWVKRSHSLESLARALEPIYARLWEQVARPTA
jgi:glycosyltransferase involved in cell wall biosynthesis